MTNKHVSLAQPILFEDLFENVLDMTHPLCRLREAINWKGFDLKVGALFGDTKKRRPPIPTRLMVALHYLKYAYNLSDEDVVERFSENNYWQYFAGFNRFTPGLPCDATTMVKWRKRVKAKGLETLFEETLEVAKRNKFIGRKDCEKVIVDTTVQEKNITFPTDAKLLNKAREKLVKLAKRHEISLRQTYVRLGKRALFNQARYARAKHFKKARKQTKTLRTYLGRVIRDIERKNINPDLLLQNELALASRLLQQKKSDSHKLYSLHEPHVECIAKGKAHKKYEFGCKVSVVTTAKSNWILSTMALHGNPFDGHTLNGALSDAERMSKRTIKSAYVDRGYRGSVRSVDQDVFIAGTRKKRGCKATHRKWMRRRSAIEPVIGHLKSDHRMNRNRLKGEEGDRINALLAAAGFNFAKLLAAFFFLFGSTSLPVA